MERILLLQIWKRCLGDCRIQQTDSKTDQSVCQCLCLVNFDRHQVVHEDNFWYGLGSLRHSGIPVLKNLQSLS